MRKRFTFYLVGLLIPFLILGIIELLLLLLGYGSIEPLFIEDENNSLYLKQNELVGTRYFPNLTDVPHSCYDPFLKNKPKNSFRIFVLGASTTAGFPYSHGVSFPRQLKSLLEQNYSNIHFEVINTSFAAINSYTIKDFAREVVKYDPDLVLIYMGHNEFYGAYGVGSQIGSKIGLSYDHIRKLRKIRIYKLFESSYQSLKKQRKLNLEDDVETLMSKVVAHPSIDINSNMYRGGLEQFRNNLATTFEIFKDNNVDVVVSNLVSNEKDHFPFDFLSVYPNDQKSKIIELVHSFKVKELENEFITLLQADENSALGYFLKGHYSVFLGDTLIAKNLFTKAKDFDKVRFRASSDINTIIDSIAAAHNIHFIDSKTAFEKASPFGIIGKEFIAEHLHPNDSGYFLLAKEFFNFCESKYGQKWGKDRLTNDSVYFIKPYTSVETNLASFFLQRIYNSWPFVIIEESSKDLPIKNLENDSTQFSFKLATHLFEEKITWPEAMNLYYNFNKDNGNNKELLNISYALFQEFPYVNEVKEMYAESLLINKYSQQSLLVYQTLFNSTREDKYLVKIVSILLDGKEFDELDLLLSNVKVKNRTKQLISAASRDIKDYLTSDANDDELRIKAAGAYLYLGNLEKSVSVLSKIEDLESYKNQSDQLKKLIEQKRKIK